MWLYTRQRGLANVKSSTEAAIAANLNRIWPTALFVIENLPQKYSTVVEVSKSECTETYQSDGDATIFISSIQKNKEYYFKMKFPLWCIYFKYRK